MSSTLRICPIEESERPAAAAFARAAAWRYEHFDYSAQETYAQPGYRALDRPGRTVGILGCALDRPPVASLVYAAVDGRQRPTEVIQRLLEPHLADLRRAGVAELTFVGLAPWLARCLEGAGFVTRTTVISYQWTGGEDLPEGNAGVRLRRATPLDLEDLVALDRLAFEPMWRYSPRLHRRLYERAACMLVADVDGRAVGYQAGSFVCGQGQIIRLAVHPDWRGQGIGTRLLREALRFFRARGVSFVTLNTQADTWIARRLYQRMGFVPMDEEVPAMTRTLDGNPERRPLTAGRLIAES